MLPFVSHKEFEFIHHLQRFMQGPGTSKTALERVRHACQMGLPSQELLLNYHKNGAPMWVLLRIEVCLAASVFFLSPLTSNDSRCETETASSNI